MGAERSKAKSCEQEARDLLERMGWEQAQGLSNGEVVELANLIANVHAARQLRVRYLGWERQVIDDLCDHCMARLFKKNLLVSKREGPL